MEEIIKIKCPDCGKLLSIKKIPGIENKSLRCGACNKVHPFSDFRMVREKNEGDTEYGAGPDKTSYVHDQPLTNIVPGRLTRTDAGAASFNLRKGINIIGRKASSSVATVQIDTAPSKKMSRSHLQIEAKMVSGKGLVHYVSLCKSDINATYINGSQLFFGDTVVLNDGDVLTLPDATLKFTIPDEEGTEL